MGRSDKKFRREILVLRAHAGAALATAALRTIGRERHALDIAGVAHGHHHVFALDQVLVLDFALVLDDLGAARRGELVADGGELILDDAEHPGARAQDLEVVLDLLGELLQLFGDFVTAQCSEALQAQVENGAGLFVGQAIGALLRQRVARIGDEHDQRRHVLGGPVARHQRFSGLGRILRGADEPDHLVDVGNCNGETNQHMRTVACLVEQELGAPGNHFLAEGHEGLQQVLQVQQLRAPAGQADVVDAEGRLQRRETVELVQHDFRHRIALQLDDDPHALAVGLVADVGDAL